MDEARKAAAKLVGRMLGDPQWRRRRGTQAELPLLVALPDDTFEAVLERAEQTFPGHGSFVVASVYTAERDIVLMTVHSTMDDLPQLPRASREWTLRQMANKSALLPAGSSSDRYRVPA